MFACLLIGAECHVRHADVAQRNADVASIADLSVVVQIEQALAQPGDTVTERIGADRELIFKSLYLRGHAMLARASQSCGRDVTSFRSFSLISERLRQTLHRAQRKHVASSTLCQ